MNDDPIDKILGLRPINSIADEIPELEEKVIESLPVQIETNEVALKQSADNDETVRDIELARSNIKNIIEQGDESLKEMINLAKQSESPRAFEVASSLMKTLLDANKDFVEMSMKKKYAKEEIMNPKEEEKAQTNVVNNNLILSTTDLLKMIKGET
jgi:hypothetical protein